MKKGDLQDHLDKIIDIAKDIDPKKITILTGSNGSGKSMIRKILSFDDIKVASISMEKRAGLNMDGAMGAFTHDTDWNPTSVETLHYIQSLVKQEDRYIVIDEPEIGMGEETVLGLVNFLNENLNKLSYGAMIITHFRVIVEHLKHDNFVNVDGLSHGDWLRRKIVAVDIEKLNKDSHELFLAIQKRINENKSKKK
jgi:Fe-S cluster assembly ATPase SufC